MKNFSTGLTLVFLVMASTGITSFAQSQADPGKKAYEENCASCHGISGKGDGALRAHLVKAPPNLTILAKRNGGVFPRERVREMIDGRSATEIGPHGTREMPIWGQVYRTQGSQTADFPVRSRIDALTEFLARIQEK